MMPMPNNPAKRIQLLLQVARQAADTLSSSLEELEGELMALEREAEDHCPGDRAEIPQLTQEEIGIASVKILLTFQEAAGLLSAPLAAVRDMVDQGELPICKIGRTARIPRKELQEYISGDGRPSPIEEKIMAPEKEKSNKPTRRNRATQKTNPPGSKDETAALNKKQLLTVKEAAVILGLHYISVYRLISKNKLPSCRVGLAIRIPRTELEKYAKIARPGEGAEDEEG